MHNCLLLLCSSSCSKCRVDSPERLAHSQFFTTFARKREIPVVRNLCSQHQSGANTKRTDQISSRQQDRRLDVNDRPSNPSVKSTVILTSIGAKSGIAVKSYSPNVIRANCGHSKLQTFSRHCGIQNVALHAFQRPRAQYAGAFVAHKQRRYLRKPFISRHDAQPRASALTAQPARTLYATRGLTGNNSPAK
jgi:hypothetical protein